MAIYSKEHRDRLIDLYTEEQIGHMGGKTEGGNFPCFNPGHGGKDQKPSMRYYSGEKWAVCFKCKDDHEAKTGRAGFNLFDMIGMEIGSDDFMKQYERACEKFNDYPSEDGSLDGSRKRPSKIAQEGPEGGKGVMTREGAGNASNRILEPLKGNLDKQAEQQAAEDKEKRARAIGRAVIAAAAGGVQKYPEAMAYLKGRGFTEAIIERLGIGFLKDYPARPDLGNRIIIQYPGQDGRFAARTINDDDGRQKYLKATGLGSELWMAGLLKEKGTGPLFIVEGEIDAMTISEMCGFPAIGLGSTSNKKKLIEAVHEAKESILADKDKALIIVPDKDQGGHGQKKAEEMLKAIREEGVPALIAEIPTEREDKVDANQAYRDDSEGFRDFLGAAIEKAAEFAHDPEAVLKEEQAEKLKEYEKESQAAMLDNFEAWATRRAASPYIPTGFPFLDDHLNNGLREELYILGGVPSAGKTTFALNIADKIAERGDADVLYFSLEQGNYELTSKSLSRLTWVLSTQKEKDANLPRTNMGIIESYSFTGENEAQQRIINLRQRAVDRYKAFQGRIRIIEAGKLKAEDMTREIDRHYEATGRRPVVILDYLQKLEISNSRIIDAKPRIDQAVTDLKQLSRDKQVPVIAISSLNREGYAAPGMKNLKESGDLEYSADIVLLLGFRREKGDEDLEDYIDTQSKLNPREMFVKIAKNRNGVKGQKVNMDYYAAFNYFTDSDRQGNEIPDPPKSGKQKR